MNPFEGNRSSDSLNPPFDSALRKSSPIIAIFNLFSTMCGGGVLTLPLAFSVAGIIPTAIVMIFAAFINEFGLYNLCECARRTGEKTYMDVTRIACGIKAEILTTMVLCFNLFFSFIAYMVLAKDIWTPFALYLCPSLKSYVSNRLNEAATHEEIVQEAGHYVLIFILCVTSPLLLKKDLYALRHACYVGFISLSILTIALVYKAYEKNVILRPGRFQQEVKWWSWNISDWIYTFPIVGLSFVCSYNVLSIQASLINPTRKRMRLVLTASNLLCLCFYMTVGISGYLTAYSKTQGNIFLNFYFSDKVMLLGRLGYGITIVFAIPMVLLPCREAVLSFKGQFEKLKAEMQQYSEPDYKIDEETPLTKFPNGNGDSSKNCSYEQTNESKNKTGFYVSTKIDNSRSPRNAESILHFCSTFFIVLISYYGAVAVPGVAVIWSISGSSVSICLAFTLPSLVYINICACEGFTQRMIGSWILLMFSFVAAFLCTNQTLRNL